MASKAGHNLRPVLKDRLPRFEKSPIIVTADLLASLPQDVPRALRGVNDAKVWLVRRQEYGLEMVKWGEVERQLIRFRRDRKSVV